MALRVRQAKLRLPSRLDRYLWLLTNSSPVSWAVWFSCLHLFWSLFCLPRRDLALRNRSNSRMRLASTPTKVTIIIMVAEQVGGCGAKVQMTNERSVTGHIGAATSLGVWQPWPLLQLRFSRYCTALNLAVRNQGPGLLLSSCRSSSRFCCFSL